MMFRNPKGLIRFKFYLCLREESHLEIFRNPLPHLVLRRDGIRHSRNFSVHLCDL